MATEWMPSVRAAEAHTAWECCSNWIGQKPATSCSILQIRASGAACSTFWELFNSRYDQPPGRSTPFPPPVGANAPDSSGNPDRKVSNRIDLGGPVGSQP